MKTYLVIVVTVFLVSCGSDRDVIKEELAVSELILQQEAEWKAKGIESYVFTYSSIPTDCPTAEPFPPVEIEVVEGKITSLYIASNDSYLNIDESDYPSINQLFSLMKQHVSKIQGLPEFDKTLHFPV